MGLATGRHPLGAGELREVQPVPGLFGQAPQILQLRPPVAFSERMDVVDVANNYARLLTELRSAQAAQELLVNQSAMHVGHADGDKAERLESRAPFRDLDCPNVARPLENILEQVPMDRAKMIEVEAAGRRSFRDALGRSSRS